MNNSLSSRLGVENVSHLFLTNKRRKMRRRSFRLSHWTILEVNCSQISLLQHSVSNTPTVTATVTSKVLPNAKSLKNFRALNFKGKMRLNSKSRLKMDEIN